PPSSPPGFLLASTGTGVTLSQEGRSHRRCGEGGGLRVGLMIGPERGRYRTKIERLRSDARWAEEAGLATVWIPQIPDEFDALTAVALVGVATSRIEIG